MPWISEIQIPDVNENNDNDFVDPPRNTPNAQWQGNIPRPLNITPTVPLRRSQRTRKPNRKFE